MQEPSQTRPVTDWRRLRLATGMSLAELAKLSGVHKPVISQIETGRMVPTAAEAAAILRALGEAA